MPLRKWIGSRPSFSHLRCIRSFHPKPPLLDRYWPPEHHGASLAATCSLAMDLVVARFFAESTYQLTLLEVPTWGPGVLFTPNYKINTLGRICLEGNTLRRFLHVEAQKKHRWAFLAIFVLKGWKFPAPKHIWETVQNPHRIAHARMKETYSNIKT